MEACGSAHFWAREVRRAGHEVLLLPAHRVRPYVGRNKTDASDARALLEAVRNQEIRPVPVKTVPQQALASLHRQRSAWLATRTARLNGVRGCLRELGIFIPVGARNVLPALQEALEDADSGVPDGVRLTLAALGAEVQSLEANLRLAERQLEALAAETPVVARLRTIPGVGLLTATALVAFVGEVERFPSGRHFASYLGLTPRERSSGFVRRLGAISKKGDTYVRMLLTHGARAVLWGAKRLENPDRLRTWALQVEKLRGHNKAAIALANKLARIIWVVWRTGKEFEVQPVA
jgi:transposase